MFILNFHLGTLNPISSGNRSSSNMGRQGIGAGVIGALEGDLGYLGGGHWVLDGNVGTQIHVQTPVMENICTQDHHITKMIPGLL